MEIRVRLRRVDPHLLGHVSGNGRGADKSLRVPREGLFQRPLSRGENPRGATVVNRLWGHHPDARMVALNAVRPEFAFVAAVWPAGVALADLTLPVEMALKGPVLAFALLLLLVDIPQYLKRDECAILRWSFGARVAACASLVLMTIFIRGAERVPFMYFKF